MHAIRNLARIAFGTARVRWSQLGFGRTSSTSTAQATPRNLLGFKDGTANLKAEETAERRAARLGRRPTATAPRRWLAGRLATWSPGGSGCASRPGTGTSLREQEQIIGRTKAEGAPLSGGTEFTRARLRHARAPTERR